MADLVAQDELKAADEEKAAYEAAQQANLLNHQQTPSTPEDLSFVVRGLSALTRLYFGNSPSIKTQVSPAGTKEESHYSEFKRSIPSININVARADEGSDDWGYKVNNFHGSFLPRIFERCGAKISFDNNYNVFDAHLEVFGNPALLRQAVEAELHKQRNLGLLPVPVSAI